MNIVTVVSAKKLIPAQQKKVESFLAELHGSEYTANYKIDDSIIGGIVIYDGDRVYDGSVIHQLSLIKNKLTK